MHEASHEAFILDSFCAILEPSGELRDICLCFTLGFDSVDITGR